MLFFKFSNLFFDNISVNRNMVIGITREREREDVWSKAECSRDWLIRVLLNVSCRRHNGPILRCRANIHPISRYVRLISETIRNPFSVPWKSIGRTMRQLYFVIALIHNNRFIPFIIIILLVIVYTYLNQTHARTNHRHSFVCKAIYKVYLIWRTVGKRTF